MADDVIAGRYRLLEPLGRGAMSSVWLAEDEDLGRQVALKTLGENADRARFEREARAAAALSHPNICQLYDYGEAEGRPYMVLELLPGGTLEERLRGERPLPDAEAQTLAEGIAAGLAHAHERALVHRDLKPANVLFDVEGRPKIADFGIARMGGSGTLTEAGTVLGTASYISPEQAAGLTATPASDIYSFGVILFRMLTGRLPFVSKNAMELVRMHRDDVPPTVSELRPDAPERLATIVAATLAKDPAQRPADGSALLADLRGLDPEHATGVLAPAAATGTADTASATQVIAAPPRVRRPARRLVPLLAALGALAVGGALAYAISRGGEASTPATTARAQTGLSLPTVAPDTTTSSASTSTGSLTTAASSTVATTTAAPATSAATTTRSTSSRATTTARVTTAPPPVTTAPPPATTAATTPTTAATTTASTATTTTDATTTTAPVP